LNHSLDSITLRQAIEGRCSVRNFSKEPVSRDTVQTLLSLAVRAPTAMHIEPWEFVLVQDKALLKRISDISRDSMRALMTELHQTSGSLGLSEQAEFDAFHGASTLIVICARQDGRFMQADCWLAAQNLMLGAFGMGFGTCVIGMTLAALNRPDIKQSLGIPPKFEAVAPIIVGIPVGKGTSIVRKPPHVLAWLS